MSSPEPVVYCDTNLSRLWAKVLIHAIEHPGKEISPLLMSLSGFGGMDPIPELPSIRAALDAHLRNQDHFEVATVANTIFPQSVWRISGGDRNVLYREYLEALPRYAAMEPANKKGTYFSRLIAYDMNALTGERIPNLAGVPEDGNQLEFVIKHFTDGRPLRDSAFQTSVFDPTRDHSTQPYQRFPCMQHLSFIRTESGGLNINAFYATQYLVRKAYGNLLGISRLGQFVAGQIGSTLDRVNLFVGCEKLELAKSDGALAPVVAAAKAELQPDVVAAAPANQPTKVRP